MGSGWWPSRSSGASGTPRPWAHCQLPLDPRKQFTCSPPPPARSSPGPVGPRGRAARRWAGAVSFSWAAGARCLSRPTPTPASARAPRRGLLVRQPGAVVVLGELKCPSELRSGSRPRGAGYRSRRPAGAACQPAGSDAEGGAGELNSREAAPRVAFPAQCSSPPDRASETSCPPRPGGRSSFREAGGKARLIFSGQVPPSALAPEPKRWTLTAGLRFAEARFWAESQPAR